MTVSSITASQTFAGDGSTRIFTCPFRVLSAAEMQVFLVTVATGAVQQLALTSDFSVSSVGDANAVVTTVATYSSAYQLRCKRKTTRLQDIDYRDNDPFPAETHERGLDRLTMIAQEDEEAIGRTIRAPDGETLTVLPSAASRAGKTMVFDSAGQLVTQVPADGSAASVVALLAGTSDVSEGDAMLGVKQPETGAVARTQHGKNADTLSLLDFGAAGAGGDDTAFFQLAVDTHKRIHVPKGNYAITTVTIDRYGCDIVFDKEAVVTVNGDGFKRDLDQTPRATFIAANALLDATNYYYTARYSGGTFICGASDTAISDRVPFLVDTGASPSQILLQRPLVVEGANFVLGSASAIGVGIHGGWGAVVRGNTFTAAGVDAIAINIGASNADGDSSCHPQEILVDGNVFNSCRPFASAAGGCTNAAEGLLVRGNFFNFVRLAELNTINSVRWIGNQLVTDTKSLDLVDCTDVTLADSYFESNHDPDNASKPAIVNLQNCADTKVVNNAFNVLATAVATARDGILIKANSSNAMRGVLVAGNRFQHAAYNATLETNAIRFATAGGSGQLLDVTVRDNVCNEWHNAVNFTDHITTLATGVHLENVSNNGGVRFVKGIARVAPSALRAPGLWEQFSATISGKSIGGGVASTCGSAFWPTVMRSAAPAVAVTNFANVVNASGVSASWATIGANTVHITVQQTTGSAAGDLVQGSATITVDGTAV
jgi:hypothetical protein